MVNRYRLVYTESGGSTQEVGRMSFEGTGTSPGNATGRLKKARWHPRAKNMKKLSVWADENLFGALPVDVTEHQGDEPEMLWQEYDGSSWVDKFRGFPTSEGIITENGNVKFTLFSFLRWLGMQRVQLDPSTNSNLVNTDNVTVMEELLPSGYVVDAPASGDISGGYETIERYRLDDQRKVGFRDLTRDFNWSLKTLPEKDSNGNWKVRYEPDGYGGTVDTVYNKKSDSTGTSPGQFKEWSKLRVKDVVNKALVIGNDSDRNRIVSDAKTNQTSIDTYGERFERVQVGYVESKAEADRIAQNIVDNKGEPTEGGRVTVAPRYSDDVTNDSFELRDSLRNIDGVYTCVKQINFYPENRTYLDFNFEADGEKKAKRKENLRDERSKILDSSTENVSGQTGSASPGVSGDTGSTAPDVGGDTGNTSPDVDGDTGNTGPNVSGNTDAGGDVNLIDDDADNTSFSSGLFNSFNNILSTSANVGSDGAAGMVIYINATKTSSNSSREFAEIEVGVTVNGTEVAEINGNYPTFTLFQDTDKGMLMNASLWVPATIDDNDNVDVNVRGPSGGTQPVAFDCLLQFIDTHEHGDGTLDTDSHPHGDGTLDTDNHPHDDGTLDTDNHPHGDGSLGTDNHPHDQGTLETVIDFITNLAR